MSPLRKYAVLGYEPTLVEKTIMELHIKIYGNPIKLHPQDRYDNAD
jgi:hypothetical protein